MVEQPPRAPPPVMAAPVLVFMTEVAVTWVPAASTAAMRLSLCMSVTHIFFLRYGYDIT
jgi:hypothetical protein